MPALSSPPRRSRASTRRQPAAAPPSAAATRVAGSASSSSSTALPVRARAGVAIASVRPTERASSMASSDGVGRASGRNSPSYGSSATAAAPKIQPVPWYDARAVPGSSATASVPAGAERATANLRETFARRAGRAAAAPWGRLDHGHVGGAALQRRHVGPEACHRGARRSGLEVLDERLDDLEPRLEGLPRVQFTPLAGRWQLEDAVRDAERRRLTRATF